MAAGAMSLTVTSYANKHGGRENSTQLNVLK